MRNKRQSVSLMLPLTSMAVLRNILCQSPFNLMRGNCKNKIVMGEERTLKLLSQLRGGPRSF